MRKYIKLIILLTCFAASPSYSAWDNSCLNTCFSTNHECNYCAYQCRVENEPSPIDMPPREYHCALDGYTS